MKLRQRNVCTNLLKKAKAGYFENLKPSSITDNKTFWKNVKPLFSDKSLFSDNISLVENNPIITDDAKMAEIFNSHFSNAVERLCISFPYESIPSEFDNDDPILSAIEKYKSHPSIMKIKDVVDNTSIFSFKSGWVSGFFFMDSIYVEETFKAVSSFILFSSPFSQYLGENDCINSNNSPYCSLFVKN